MTTFWDCRFCTVQLEYHKHGCHTINGTQAPQRPGSIRLSERGKEYLWDRSSSYHMQGKMRWTAKKLSPGLPVAQEIR